VEGPNIQPKEPIKFVPPVPEGLLEALGQSAEYKNSGMGRPYQGGTYIPPSVPEAGKPVNEDNHENFLHESGLLGGGGGGDFQITPSLSVDLSPPQNGGFPSLDSYGSQSVVGGSIAQAIDPASQVAPSAYGQSELGVPPAVSYQNNNLLAPGESTGGEGAPEVNQFIQSLGLEGNSVIQSQSIDLGSQQLANFQGGHFITQPTGSGFQNIPIQGNHGSYTLQIQPAGGVGSTGQQSIAHDQVLSNGLLQDILAAIEQQQPANQQQGLQQLYGHVEPLHQAASNSFYQYQQVGGDSEPQGSAVNERVVNTTEGRNTLTDFSNNTAGLELLPLDTAGLSDQERFSTYLARNGVALYYNSEHGKNQTFIPEETQNESPDINLLDSNQPKEDGSYVIFKSPDVKYKYGAISEDTSIDLLATNSTQPSSESKDLT